MMKKSSNSQEIHELTGAEIARQVASLNKRRSEITNQRATWFANALKSGFGGDAPMVDADERAAREHAKALLNGSAPASLSLPPEITLDKQLAREQRGIDIALKILNDKDLIARSAEAVAWAEDNEAEWRRLAREIVLTMQRLEALKVAADKLLDRCPDLSAVKLPGAIIAHHLKPIHPGDVPLADLTDLAIAEGILTQAQIRKSVDV